METKANYLLIGLFTLAGLLGSMVFLIWLAKVEVEKQYSYYEVIFDNVTGLSNAGDVRYNGLPVGQVVGLALDPDDPSKVRVRIEVDAATPIKTDTEATLQSQGVTGVSMVALTGGSFDADPLPQDGVIVAGRSPLQSVLEGAPVLLERAVELLEDVREVVNEDNRAAVSETLGNLASASGRLDRALTDFESLSEDLSVAATELAGFTTRLESLADTADETLRTATETLRQGQDTLASGETTLAAATETLKTVDTAFAAATGLMENEIPQFVTQGTQTASQIETSLQKLEAPALEALASANTALSEAEQTFSAANRVFDEDIDGMINDVRSAVTTFRDTVTNASENIDAISGEVLAASQSAATFASTLETVVVSNQRQLSNFLRLGLPEFLRLTEEGRQLVRNLDRFINRIDRDPARYIFGTQGSEFNR